MRLMFLGDVIGRAGRKVVVDVLPGLREKYKIDFVAINGENAASGFGITEKILADLFDAGADVVTLGNHSFDQREALVFIGKYPNLIRPMNYPPGTPGRGSCLARAKNGADVLVVNVMGRVFMGEFDCPFRALDTLLTSQRLGIAADAIMVDVHAEATSEKQGLGYFCDGRVSLVAGTHTHTPTADARILPRGTGFITDVGMCGDYNSIIGMDIEEPLTRFLTRLPNGRFTPALGPATLSGVCVETDDATGLAKSIIPLRLGGLLAPIEPEDWQSNS